MKKMNNIIILITLFIGFSVFGIRAYRYNSDIQKNKEFYDNEIKECKKNLDYRGNQAYCEGLLEDGPYEAGYYESFEEVFTFSPAAFLMVGTILSCISGATLENKKTKKSKYFYECYKGIIILPLVAIVSMIVCFAITNGVGHAIIWKSFGNNVLLFNIMYLLNLFVHGFIACNICLIALKKYNNTTSGLLVSTVSILILSLFIDLFIRAFLVQTVFGVTPKITISILEFINFPSKNFIFQSMIVPSGVFIVTSILVVLIYKTKKTRN